MPVLHIGTAARDSVHPRAREPLHARAGNAHKESLRGRQTRKSSAACTLGELC